jgi:hypothetical protein
MDTIVNLVDSLKPDTPALWGKMTPQHMVEHVTMVVLISAGKLKIECYTPTERQPVMKAFLMSEKPMPRNVISPAIGPDLVPLQFNSFEEAVSNFKAAVAAFHNYFNEKPDATLTNPAFGDLNYDQWKQFHKKHLTHHFAQFGLV